MNIFIKLEGGKSIPYEVALDECDGYINEDIKRDMLKTLGVDMDIDLNLYEDSYCYNYGDNNHINDEIIIEEEYDIFPDDILIYNEIYTFIPSRRLLAAVKLKDSYVGYDLENWKLKVIAYGHNGCINDLYRDEVEFLLQENIEVYYGDEDNGYILDIIHNDDVDELSLYLENGGYVNTGDNWDIECRSKCRYDIFTCCLRAHESDRNTLELIELLRPYFNINKISEDGRTYLMQAAISGDIESVKYIANDKDFRMLFHKTPDNLYASDMAATREIKRYLKGKMSKSTQ